MKYTPPGFNTGIFTLLLGIAALVLLYRNDKKTNKVLLARAKERERIKNGLPPENAAAPGKKPAVIKSKGAPSGTQKTEQKAEEKPSSVKEMAEKAEGKAVEEMSSAEYLAAVETKQIKKQPNGKKKSGGKKKKK